MFQLADLFEPKGPEAIAAIVTVIALENMVSAVAEGMERTARMIEPATYRAIYETSNTEEHARRLH